MKPPPLDRVLALLGAAQDSRGRVPMETAADLLGVRSRDLPGVVAALSVIELPPHGECLDVSIDGSDVVFFGLPSLARTAPLSPADGALILSALSSLGRRSPRRLAQLCGEAARAIRAGFSAEDVGEAEDQSGALTWAADTAASPALLSVLHDAALARRVVRLTYWNSSRDRVEDRRAAPLGLVQHTGRWYLSAHDLDRGAQRWFRLERVLAAAATDDAFASAPAPPVAREILFDPPEVEVEMVVSVDPGHRKRFRSRMGAVCGEATPRGLVLRGPTFETLLRYLFARSSDWEVVSPPEARELARRWAGG